MLTLYKVLFQVEDISIILTNVFFFSFPLPTPDREISGLQVAADAISPGETALINVTMATGTDIMLSVDFGDGSEMHRENFTEYIDLPSSFQVCSG